MTKFAVILPAAGQSQRFHDKNYKKPFAMMANRPVWLVTAERFLNRADVAQTIVVISANDRSMFQMKFGANIAILGIELVDGGASRADSVQAGLTRVREEIDFVAVHDAVRPCLADAWIDQVFDAAKTSGAAILAVPCVCTLKESQDGRHVSQTVTREKLWEAQTPQVFRRSLLIEAFARRGKLDATDESQLVEQLGHAVTLVTGSRLNIKITTREDLRLAEAALNVLPKPKLASGFHPFADDDKWR
jgi:2-C-methyl-D-erythritol 4-phosphate cytidylyltransferase